MSKRKTKTARRKRGECYLALEFWELESPAFGHLSADATRVYLFIRKAMDFDAGNNGAVRFSHRDATEALHAGGWRRGANALAELRHYGFIKLRNGTDLGPNIRLVCEWQLTAFPCGGQPAAKTFMRWDGTAFEPPYRAKLGKPTAEKQAPTFTMKTPRRQHEDAPHPKSGVDTPQNGQTVGNMKTLRAGGRRQHEGSSTSTTQGGPLDGAHRRPWHAPGWLVGSSLSLGEGAKRGVKTAAASKPPAKRCRPRRAQTTWNGRPLLRQRVLALLLTEARPWTRAEIVDKLGLKFAPEAQRALGELCARGQAARVSHGLYRATKAARTAP